MRIILKQFFLTIIKKFPLMISLLLSLTIMVITASVGSFVVATISSSNNRINNDGNASDIIIDNIAKNLNIEYKEIFLDNLPYDPVNNKEITTVNMNNVDPKVSEMIILPINVDDYTRLINTPLPTWEQTAANNENYKANNGGNPDLQKLKSEFISPASLLLFLQNNMLGFYLSSINMDNPNGPNDVYLDPRLITFEEKKDAPIISGIYQDFNLASSVKVKESSMKIFKDIPLFNPLSLTNKNIRKAGLHLNVGAAFTFSSKDSMWKKNFSNENVLFNYFESIPNISKSIPDTKPQKDSGIPYLEKVTGLKITLKLNENIDPLTKLYLDNNPGKKTKEILMTPFQASNGQYETIPTTQPYLDNFNSSVSRFILNFKESENAILKQEVSKFAELLVLESLETLDWTQSQNVQVVQDDKTYLFTSREMNDINQVVLEGNSRELFKNEENSSDFKILGERNGDNASFAAIYKYVQTIYNSKIFDTNKNLEGNPIYVGSPHGEIRTKKERRLLKNIINDTLAAFDKVDKDTGLIQPQELGMTTEQRVLKTDSNKIVAITEMPIWYEFFVTFGKYTNIGTFSNSLNSNISFKPDRSFSTIDSTNSSASKSNFDNYGVLVSSSHYDARKLKIVEETKIDKMKDYITEKENNAIKNNQEFDFHGWTLEAMNESLEPEQKIVINGQSFFINGYGNAPDFKSPIIDLTKPIPNVYNEAIIYVNESQFSVVNSGNRGNFLGKIINIKSSGNSPFAAENLINELNEYWDKKFQNSSSPKKSENPFNIYLNNDFANFPNNTTFRWHYFDLIILVLSISSLVFSLILLALIIYILSMIIKFIFESLGFSIAIARANGIPRRKIMLGLSIIIIGISSLFIATAFIIGYFVTPLFFGILSGFWFAPFSLPTFPWWGIFISIGVATLVVGGIISLITLLTLNKPILLTLSGNDIVKTNKLSGIVRSNKIKIGPLSKLRISMMSTNVGKISLISVLLGLSFGVTTTTFSLSEKVLEAKDNNESTKKYAYAFDYETPQYQTGLTKNLSYNQLGEISEERRILTILDVTDPYYQLLYDPASDPKNPEYLSNPLLAKRKVVNFDAIVGPNSLPETTILWRNSGELKTYENILLPSSRTYSKFSNSDTKLMFNSVLSAEILDIDVGTFAGIQVGNLWDHVSSSFPATIKLRLESNIQSYRKSVLEKYPWYEQFLIKKLNSENIEEIVYPLEIDASIAFDKTNVRFNDNYLIALGVFLGDEDLNKENVLINFNFTANDAISDEPYTYVIGTNNYNNERIKLFGIKNDSNYINLRSSSGSSLNELINTKSNKVIVNEGAAYKNSWSIGEEITIKIENDYYRDVTDIIEKISINPMPIQSKEVTLEIVGISTDSIGETFWINQEYANSLISLDNADYVTNYDPNPIFPNSGVYDYVQRKSFENITNPTTGVVIANMAWNGFFSKNETPLISTVSVPMASTVGTYPGFFDIQRLANNAKDYEQLLELYTPQYNSSTVKIYEHVNVDDPSVGTDRLLLKEFLSDSFQTPSIFIKSLSNNYNDSMYKPSIITLDGIAVSDKIFNLVSTASWIASITITLSFIPLLIITVMVSILSLTDDFRKSMSILRVLGINKRNTIGSIALVYLPIIISGVLLGVLFSFFLNLIFQSLLLNTLSVFLTTTINGLVYGVAIGVMVGLMSIIVLITTIILMREKLEKSIKF